jgi:non-ribosomal peptide synthetase component F
MAGSEARRRSWLLLAAFQALLSRVTGAEGLRNRHAGRGASLVELEPIIGYFANFVVVRADVSGEPDAGTLIGRVRECVLDALEWHQAPFNRVVDALGVPRDPSQEPAVSRSPSLHAKSGRGTSISRRQSAPRRCGRRRTRSSISPWPS